MRIDLVNAGKRFNREWIFRHFNYHFSSGTAYAITGPNGSGKSTLLQVIATAASISEGSVKFYTNDEILSPDLIYKKIGFVAPYLDIIEEMTLTEFLNFHNSLKPLISSVTISEIIEEIGLTASSEKQIRYFSSGMKQRVKLAQSIFSAVDILLLDEPCTNLDDAGFELYKQLINNYCADRLLIISSNVREEYYCCRNILNMNEIK